jgi:hypothetical protein
MQCNMPFASVRLELAMLSQLANAMLLALESNEVIWMRMTQLGSSGPAEAVSEIAVMVSEKIEAGASALTNLAAGQSTDEVVTAYREVVQANLKRLSA